MKRVCRQGSVVILCGALTLGAGACRKAGPAAGAGGAPGGRPPVVVQCAPAVQQDAPVVVTAFGTLEERVNVDVVPQVSGVLTRTLVADGAVVTNGQPLFAIDDRDYAARVRQAEAAVAAGRANLAQGRATLERNRGLLAKQLIAADQFETLDTRVAALAAQVQADEATLDLARLNLSRCTVTAAVAGVCGKRYVDEGNLVGAGLTRLINIRNCDPVDVECTLPEALLGDVRRALAAGPVSLEVTPRGETNRYSGRLTFVDNAVNSASGTILVRGEVPNPARRLWARQFVDVRILAATVAGAILVPE